MKRKFIFLWVLLIALCVQVSAQNWTWTGETPTSGNSYYLLADLNDGVARFLNNTTNSFDSEPKVIWRMGGTFSTSYTLTSAGGKFAIRKPFSSTTVETDSNRSGDDVTLSSNGSSSDKYTIYRSKTFSLGGNRNIAVNSSGISTASSATQCWRFVSEAEAAAYDNYIAAWTKLNALSVANPSMPKASEVSSALSTATNYSNAASNTKTLNDLYTACFEAATKANPLNVTMFIKNPGYEAATWNDGWTAEGFVDHANGGKFSGSHAPEMWSGNLTSGKISQTLTGLPVGTYQLSATVTGGFGGETSVYAMEEARKVAVPGINDDPVQHPVVPFVVHNDTEGASVEIGFKRDNCRYWTAVDDWTLSYYPAEEYEWVNGVRLDGSYLSKPAYTSTPADGVDPSHANDALMVVTWRDNYTNDVKTPWALVPGSKAEVWTDGAKLTDVNLLTDFRSSHYDNGFGLYIPDFDETKTYTIKVPANVFGYTAVGHGNEAFEVQAVASPLKDGKYFVVVKGTGKHVSRGKGWGTQAILDYYGVPMMVQTAGLTVFKFLDNNAFLGSDPSDDWLYTDIQGSEANKVRRYVLIPGEGAREGEFQFYAPSRDKYLSHVTNSINGESYEAVNEGSSADYFQFELLDAEGYAAHLAKIEEDEAIRVAAHAGFGVKNKSEYDELIEMWETDGFTPTFPSNATEETAAAKYYERKNEELACGAVWEGTPRDLVGGDKVSLTLKKGLYVMYCDAFQQAMNLTTLQANQGFRGLTYMYVKVGSEMYKSQLKSITETTDAIPTDEASATTALDAGNYRNSVIFYVPADGTNVEFGVENPQRLGNGVDETAGSWVAFKNIKVEKFNAELVEASMTVNKGKYGTFLAPFAVTMPEGVTAYKATLVEGKTTVQLETLAGPGETLNAKLPVVLKNDGEASVTKRVFRGVNEATTDTETLGNLVGFYTSGQTVPNNGKSYVLQTQTIEGESVQAFFKVSSTFTGTANRCYIVAPDGGASLVKAYAFTDEDAENVTTALGLVQADEKPESKTVFDLSGRRVQNVQKGIYIINGKKVVIK